MFQILNLIMSGRKAVGAPLQAGETGSVEPDTDL